MKTLDEVIKNLEDGTEHLSAMLISRETWSDTLHYLQEYKAKMKVLEYKSKRYDEMCETIQKQGQEHEDRCQAEIARYQEAVRNCEEAENKYKRLLKDLEENPPLTWDELKTMEGMPVWVEVKGYNGCWTIVHWNSDIVFVEFYDWIASPDDFMKAPLVSLDNTNFGKTWQAYRKERK